MGLTGVGRRPWIPADNRSELAEIRELKGLAETFLLVLAIAPREC